MGKDKKDKKKGKKQKIVTFKDKTYSVIFENLFDSEKYSDFVIKTEKGTTIKSHKYILASSSDYFSDLILKDNASEVTVKEENESLFKDFIKFFYTGAFDIAKEENTFGFFLLLSKYKVKYAKEIKLPAKSLFTGLISYVEKDLSNRQSEFDNLIELINLKKVSKDLLKKTAKKTKWLSNNTKFMNMLVKKKKESSDDSDSDSDKSDKSSDDSDKSSDDSDKSSDDSSDKSESDDDDDEGSVPKFDKKLSNPKSFEVKKNRIIKYTQGGSWAGNFLLKETELYSFKVISSAYGYVMFGYSPKDGFNFNSSVHSNCGFYFYMCNGSQYWQNNSAQSNYNITNKQYGYTSGTIYSVKFDKKKRTITYWKDKQLLGIYYQNIDKKYKKLHPAFSFNNNGDTIELIKNPKLKNK